MRPRRRVVGAIAATLAVLIVPTGPLSAILNDVNAKGGPGAGFTPIPA